jgi:hypothetical protein
MTDGNPRNDQAPLVAVLQLGSWLSYHGYLDDDVTQKSLSW